MKKYLAIGFVFSFLFLATNAFASDTSTLFTTGNGNYGAWSGGESDVDEVEDVSCSSGDFISESTTLDRESYTMDISSVPDGATITNVSISVWDRIEEVSGGTYKTFARLNGIDTDATSELSVSGESPSCSEEKTQSIDVPDAVKSGSTTLEIGVLKTETNSNLVRVGAIRAVVSYTVAPSTGTITVHKNVLGSDGETNVADNHSFVVVLAGEDSQSVSEESPHAYSNLVAGTYTITENEDSNYDFVSFSSDSNLDLSGAQVIVVAGINFDLTITNKQKPVPPPEEEPEDQQPAPEAPHGTGGGGGITLPPSPPVASPTPPVGEVLGASIEAPKECIPYLNAYMKKGTHNDLVQVKLLQTFLNEHLLIEPKIIEDGIFGLATEKAVIIFQEKYKEEILTPWVPFGLNDNKGTGYVFKTTLWKINSLKCNTLLPFPKLP